MRKSDDSPDAIIGVYWSERRKCWEVTGSARGLASMYLSAETTVGMDEVVLRALVTAVRRELEALLAF